jgi:hypothetical protein
MRCKTCLVAALVAAMPIAAAAECPVRLLEVPRTWGQPTSRSKDDMQLYQPNGIRMLGKNVSYVVVDRERTVAHYRLAGETRTSGEPLSKPLLAAFLRAYPQGVCSDRMGGASCSHYTMSASTSRDLVSIDLMDDDPPGYQWTGAGSRLVQADQTLADDGKGPVYLTCKFRGY